jgi:hypothetical protein
MRQLSNRIGMTDIRVIGSIGLWFRLSHRSPPEAAPGKLIFPRLLVNIYRGENLCVFSLCKSTCTLIMSSTEKAASQPYSVTDDEPSDVPSTTTMDGGVLAPPNVTNNDHVIIVDWNGPDDPENPRKWVIFISVLLPFVSL